MFVLIFTFYKTQKHDKHITIIPKNNFKVYLKSTEVFKYILCVEL